MSRTGDSIEKPSGGETAGGPASLDDLVDEASLESFPCSDPPTFTSLHAGTPIPVTTPQTSDGERERAQRAEEHVDRARDTRVHALARAQRAEEHVDRARDTRIRALARAQGVFFVATGLWPVVRMRSFEAVTGRKRDRWLVRTVGLLVTCIGGALLAGARARRVREEVALLGTTTSAALAAIDVVYTAKRVLPKVYLLDAIAELGLVTAWIALYGPRRERVPMARA